MLWATSDYIKPGFMLTPNMINSSLLNKKLMYFSVSIIKNKERCLRKEVSSRGLRTILRGEWIRTWVMHWLILSHPATVLQFLITSFQNHSILCNCKKFIKSKVLNHFALTGLSVIGKN